MKYNPMNKEFQKEAEKLGLTGYQYYSKLVKDGKIVNPTDVERRNKEEFLKRNNFENIREWKEEWAKDKGWKDYKEYNRDNQNRRRWNNGISIPISENEECTDYIGVYIGEDIAKLVLTEIFGDVINIMPHGNHGYDAIVTGGYKVDVKTGTLTESGAHQGYRYVLKNNYIPDYFLLLGIDNGKVSHIWLFTKDDIIKGKQFYMRDSILITNKTRYLLEYQRFDLINKLNCIYEVNNRLKELMD